MNKTRTKIQTCLQKKSFPPNRTIAWLIIIADAKKTNYEMALREDAKAIFLESTSPIG